MGSPRQEHIENLFAHPKMAERFEKPTFTPGVSSRALRTRYGCLQVANEAGLLPREEWEAIGTNEKGAYEQHNTDQFFDCLEGIPISTENRKGNQYDLKLHYSVELWQKAKSINRGRAVLACTFAHLIALKKFVEGSFDLIIEDNVRAPVDCCAERIWESMAASLEQQEQTSSACHFRFLGWLGSIPNLEWILETHLKKRAFQRTNTDPPSSTISVSPFPLSEHLKADLGEQVTTNETETEQDDKEKEEEEEEEAAGNAKGAHTKPGGNLIWGSYAYWISKEAYERLLETLRNDVGAMLWKGKRMRTYSVKPIDKILPRQIIASFGPDSVQLATQPAFFRAPMLTSKIHTQWDPEFCKSTKYQLRHGGLSWSDLWLSDTEQQIVKHHQTYGDWLTIKELEMMGDEKKKKI
jgi:hypothetical protein